MAAPIGVGHLRQICCNIWRNQIFRKSPAFFSLNRKRNETHGLLTSRAAISARPFHTSHTLGDLMEFFDKEKNWKETEIKCGRPWRKAELRLKSNGDLHKLWYVLLKERNMVMTMEAECNRNMELLPQPERLEKVEESMENILDVVDERNRAYHFLETGKSGEAEQYRTLNVLGIPSWKRPAEHYVPSYMNTKLIQKMRLLGPWVNHYLRLLREKELKREWRNERRRERYKQKLLKEFPDLEPQLVDEVHFAPKKPFFESDEK